MWTVVLVLGLLATYGCCRRLCLLCGEPRRAVAAGGALVLLATLPELVCRITHDMRLALLVHAAVAGMVFLVLEPAARAVPLPPRRRPHGLVLAGAAVLCVMVAWAAIGGFWWDEYSCHFMLVGALSRGIAPPLHGLYPSEPLRYHYGFDVIASLFDVAGGLELEHAIDAATLLSFGALLWTSYELAYALGGRAAASAALFLVPLGSGALQMFLFQDTGALEMRLPLIPDAFLKDSSPPVISNFFQHPQGLGMPVAFALIMLFSERAEDPFRARRLGLASLLLGLSSLVHVVFFGVLGLALGSAFLIRAFQRRRVLPLLGELSALVAALGLAVWLGGLVGGAVHSDQVMKLGTPLYDGDLLERIGRHMVYFGVPLLALPFAVWRLREDPSFPRVCLLAGAGVGFLIPNLMTYERSWDIVKFYGIGAFFANLLLADVLAPLFRTKARSLLGALVMASSIASGTVFLARMSVLDGRYGVPEIHFPPPTPIAKAVLERIGPLVPPYQRVYSTNIDLAQVGFLTPGFHWSILGTGFLIDRERATRLYLHHAHARQTMQLENLKALDVGWVILGPGDYGGLTEEGRASLEGPAFERLPDVQVPGDIRYVWRIK